MVSGIKRLGKQKTNRRGGKRINRQDDIINEKDGRIRDGEGEMGQQMVSIGHWSPSRCRSHRWTAVAGVIPRVGHPSFINSIIINIHI